MSGYGLGNWFAKLFCSASPLAKKKCIVPVAIDFASPTLNEWGSGKILGKVFHKISGPLPGPLVSNPNHVKVGKT